jgi:ABC-type glutathione transport system ATPase component
LIKPNINVSPDSKDTEKINTKVVMAKTILEVIDLKKHFTHRKGLFSSFREQSIPAVDGVSLPHENETVNGGRVGRGRRRSKNHSAA